MDEKKLFCHVGVGDNDVVSRWDYKKSVVPKIKSFIFKRMNSFDKKEIEPLIK